MAPNTTTLVAQSSFNTIAVYIYLKGICIDTFICDKTYILFQKCLVKASLQLANQLLLQFQG